LISTPEKAATAAVRARLSYSIEFVEQMGNVAAWIGALKDARAILVGKKGTRVHL
jgi:carbamate kinase